MNISIISLKPKGGGDEVELCVSLSNGSNVEHRSFTVAARMLFELGNIGAGVLPYALTEEQFDTLEYDERLWEAVKRGLGLLSYADSSARRLAEKLRARGFDAEISAAAAEYLSSLGYIDEASQLEREVRRLADKGYGRARIRQELFRKGISGDILSERLDALLDEIDFDGLLAIQLRKKLDLTRLSDARYREALTASMYRLGYPPSTTHRVLRLIVEEGE